LIIEHTLPEKKILSQKQLKANNELAAMGFNADGIVLTHLTIKNCKWISFSIL
jgi:hypothetical protein